MASAEHETLAASAFYAYTFPGAPIRINLYLDVVQRLEEHLQQHSLVEDDKSFESRGLLLGKASGFGPTEILDFKPLRRADEKELEAAMADLTPSAEGIRSVGYYRIHAEGRLQLDDADLLLARSFFPDPCCVVLLIQLPASGPPNAGFFFWHNGHMDNYCFLEFPFDAALLVPTGQARTETTPQKPVVSEPIELPPQDSRGRVSGQGKLGSRHKGWRALTASLAVISALTTGVFLARKQSEPEQRAKIIDLVPKQGLGRSMEENQRSQRQIESLLERVKELERELETARRVEQRGAGLADMERLRRGKTMASPTKSPATIARAEAENISPEEQIRPVHSRNDGEPVEYVKPSLLNSHSSPTVPQPLQSSSTPPAPNPAPERRPLEVVPPKTVAQEPVEAFSTVTAEPASDSRIGQVLGKVPLIRRLRKPSTFAPPRPLREVSPVVPSELRRGIRGQVLIDVKVYVNELGRVDYAELMSKGTGPNRSLASQAVYAARHWEFEPAHEGERKVPGQVILHYRFGHTQMASQQ